MERRYQGRCGMAVIALLVLLQSHDTMSYKPVVLIHGLMDPIPLVSLKYLALTIEQAHPGTEVTILDLFDGFDSLLPLWTQVTRIKKYLQLIIQNSTEGIHLLGYSQGGLIARGLLELMPDHNVSTFISLSSPQNGQFGDTILQRFKIFDKWLRHTVYELFYSEFGQLTSVGGYWKDPYHLDLYRKYSMFLAVLNNETYHADCITFKKNFLKIKKLVLIGGPDDGIVDPWQSSQFGFYKENSETEVIDVRDSNSYKEDWFGLKTLDKRGALEIATVPNVTHLFWPFNKRVIRDHILPWLT